MITKHKFGFLVTALVLAVSVAACGNGSAASNVGKPEDTAKAMFDAHRGEENLPFKLPHAVSGVGHCFSEATGNG